MELIAEEKIINAFNTWLIKYGFSARVIGLDTEFCWYKNTDEIGVSFVETADTISSWNKFFLDELNCSYIVDIFYTSFLHELGHSNTWHLVSEEESEIETIGMENEEYFHLPRELIASKWAVNYINKNVDAVAELIRLVGEAINFFVEANNIELDEGGFTNV
jgi:hypothetical protein